MVPRRKGNQVQNVYINGISRSYGEFYIMRRHDRWWCWADTSEIDNSHFDVAFPVYMDLPIILHTLPIMDDQFADSKPDNTCARLFGLYLRSTY